MNVDKQATRRGPRPNPLTKTNLLQAGVALFHSGGFSASGVKEIVTTAGVPKGSFYNHFESKEAFGEQVIDFYFNTGFDDLKSKLCDSRIPALERLKNYFQSRSERFRKEGYARGCMLGNFSLEVADHSERIRNKIAVNFHTWNMLLESCIAEGQQNGSISQKLPASLLARFVLNSWEGALLRMRAEKTDEPMNDFMKIIFEVVLVD